MKMVELLLLKVYLSALNHEQSCSSITVRLLILKAPNKIAADDILIFYFNLLKKIRLEFHVNPLQSRGFT